MSFPFGVPFTIRLFLLLCFCFLTLILIAFIVGTIGCFVSKISTVSTTSFECFLGPFFVGGTCEEGIIILLFFPALGMFHCLIIILQNLLNFWELHRSFSELIFYDKYSSLVLDCCREFNKCVMNVSSSIICPLFISSAHFFSVKVSQSIGLCLVFSSL